MAELGRFALGFLGGLLTVLCVGAWIGGTNRIAICCGRPDDFNDCARLGAYVYGILLGFPAGMTAGVVNLCRGPRGERPAGPSDLDASPAEPARGPGSGGD